MWVLIVGTSPQQHASGHPSITVLSSMGGRLVPKLHHTLRSIWVQSFYLGMVFSFGYSLCIWVWYSIFLEVWSFHLGMGIYIVWLFHLGVVFSFRYGLLIWVWCFHLLFVSVWSRLFIWVWSFHSGNRCGPIGLLGVQRSGNILSSAGSNYILSRPAVSTVTCCA